MSRPPLGPPQRESGGSRSASQSASVSQKTPSASSNNSSNSPSSSSNNANGQALLNNRLRSLLSHALALPLFHALHGNYTGPQGIYLAKKSRRIRDDCGNGIFKKAVTDWVLKWKQQTTEPKKPRTEPQLTESINELISGAFGKKFFQSFKEVDVKIRSKSKQGPESGRIDILLSSRPNKKRSSKPLALIEVGRNNNEWMKKLDQAGKYLDIVRNDSMNVKVKFQNAMLFAILTLEGEENTKESKFQTLFGVFLCWPNSGKGFRMTLLWSARTSDLTAASKDFGRFLRVVSSFAVWLNGGSNDKYEYLSSNVCRVNTTILRSYDSRVRESERSPDIYLNTQCKDIVGGDVQVVVKHPAEGSTETVRGFDSLWANSSSGKLQIIAFPYKIGTHLASRPADFLRIIDQLEQLHRLGYAHGDILGFNVLVGDEGGLIDFDFGGRPGKAYPKGYRRNLDDGMRLDTGDAEVTHKTLQFYHDWYALGKLMSTFHRWTSLPNSSSDDDRWLIKAALFDTSSKWNNLESTAATAADIEELKHDLKCFDQHWTVCPTDIFAEQISRFPDKKATGTFGGATGSPKPKSNV